MNGHTIGFDPQTQKLELLPIPFRSASGSTSLRLLFSVYLMGVERDHCLNCTCKHLLVENVHGEWKEMEPNFLISFFFRHLRDVLSNG